MSKKDFPELLKDSSIILAISAVMIYIFSYLYIKGFLGFYKLPTDFNVDWSFFMLTQYCVTIIKMFAPILIKCAISCFLIYIFFNDNVRELTMLMFSLLLAAFILAMLSADLKNVIIAKILKGFGYCIIIVLYIMLPCLFYSYKYNNKTWAYFSNYLNSDTFRIVTMSFIIVMLSLCGSLIYKLGLESAKNKNTYLYNEEKSAVLIFQDSTKSIFLNINDKGESQGKFFTLSDNDFDFTTYNSQIKIQ